MLRRLILQDLLLPASCLIEKMQRQVNEKGDSSSICIDLE